MARAVKEATVAELTERFASSDGAVLTEYRGLTVSQVGELRQSLGENATFSVVKNTLTKIAAKDAGVDENFSQLLAGPSAIAFVRGDIVQAAKGLRDFAKANPFLVIKGGIVDGRIVSPAEISKLADLESREVLLARLAGAMKASLSGAAATFAALPVQMVRLAAALADKRSAEQPATAADAAAPAQITADAEAPANAETPAADAEAPADTEAPADLEASADTEAPAGTETRADTGGTAASTDNS